MDVPSLIAPGISLAIGILWGMLAARLRMGWWEFVIGLVALLIIQTTIRLIVTGVI